MTQEDSGLHYNPQNMYLDYLLVGLFSNTLLNLFPLHVHLLRNANNARVMQMTNVVKVL